MKEKKREKKNKNNTLLEPHDLDRTTEAPTSIFEFLLRLLYKSNNMKTHILPSQPFGDLKLMVIFTHRYQKDKFRLDRV